MMRSTVCAVVALLATSCDAADAGAPRKHHMRERFRDLQSIERSLVAGQLEDAKALAYMLARSDAAEDRDVTSAAADLVGATSIPKALRLEARVAARCAECHAATTTKPLFPSPGRPPVAYSTPRERMQRHVWAADRLWEGVIGNSNEHWRAGLAVLAYTPALDGAPDARTLDRAMRERAANAIDSHPHDSTDERARIYGELLVTCAACHTSAASRPRGETRAQRSRIAW